MKICEKCKTENSDTAAVCRHCGEVLPVSSNWASTYMKNVKARPVNVAEKGGQKPVTAAPQGVVAPWSPAMSIGGLFLTATSFLVGAHNAGLAMALGGALSSAALVRARHEGYRGDAVICAVLALIICIVTVLAVVLMRS